MSDFFSAFVIFVIAASMMMVVALAFVFVPPLITAMRRRKLAETDDDKGKSETAAEWRFALAAAVFVIAVAPGLYWFSGEPEALAPKSDADIVVGILLSAAERAQQNGDDKNAAMLRQQAQLILQTSGEQQLAIIRRILQSAQDAAKNRGTTGQ